MRDFNSIAALGCWIYMAYQGYQLKENKELQVVMWGFNAVMFILMYLDQRLDHKDD